MAADLLEKYGNSPASNKRKIAAFLNPLPPVSYLYMVLGSLYFTRN